MQVVHIRGGFCQSVSKPRNDKNLISRDIVIKEYTSVTFPGTFHEFNDPDNKVKEITFDDLPRAEGKIRKSYIIKYISITFYILYFLFMVIFLKCKIYLNMFFRNSWIYPEQF